MLIFIVIATVLLILLHNNIYKKFWCKNLFYDTKFSSNEGFEGEYYFLEETILNNKILPLSILQVRIKEPLGLRFEDVSHDKKINPYLYSIYHAKSFFTAKKYKKFYCERRGLYRLRKAEITANNLVFSKVYNKNIDINEDFLVFPKPLDDLNDFNDLLNHIESQIMSKSFINPDPFEFYGVREYVPTDMLKHVNFKATAITQKLMVNIYRPTDNIIVDIILNFCTNNNNGEKIVALYEHCIRLCATFANYFIGKNINVGLISNGKDDRTCEPIYLSGGASEAHLYKIYECLARLNYNYNLDSISKCIDSNCINNHFYLVISSDVDDELTNTFFPALGFGKDFRQNNVYIFCCCHSKVGV